MHASTPPERSLARSRQGIAPTPSSSSHALAPWRHHDDLRAESRSLAPRGELPSDAAVQQHGFGRLRRNLTGLATLLFLAAAADAAPEIEVTWRGEEYATEALPAELTGGAIAAIATWSAWADEHDYRMDLTDDGRVLLLTEGKRLSKRTWKLVEESLAAWDTSMPPLGGLEVSVRNASTRHEEPPARPTAVLLEVDSDGDYRDLLEHLVQIDPSLERFCEGAARTAGFTIPVPLVAAWLGKPAGVDEWDPANELVHRLGALLLARDHGQPPHWLARGVAWRLEIEVEGDVACFPGREGFVYAVEHGSWPALAKNAARRLLKDDELVTLELLDAWRSGTWDDDAAVLSWAVVRWITEEKPGLLPALLAELDHARVEGSTTRYPDGSWETDGAFTLDAEAQRVIFARHLGEDFETTWTKGIAERRGR